MNWKERIRTRNGKYAFVTHYGDTWRGVRKIIIRHENGAISINGNHGRRGYIEKNEYRFPTYAEILKYEANR